MFVFVFVFIFHLKEVSELANENSCFTHVCYYFNNCLRLINILITQLPSVVSIKFQKPVVTKLKHKYLLLAILNMLLRHKR